MKIRDFTKKRYFWLLNLQFANHKKSAITNKMTATLKYDHKTIKIQLNKSTITDDLYVIFTDEHTPPDGVGTSPYQRLQLAIHPKTDVVLESLEIELPMSFAATDRVFCNGFQSWSESRMFGFHEKPDTLRWFMKPLMGHYGDYHFDFLPTKKGVLHSWTYGYRITQASTAYAIKQTENNSQITESSNPVIDFIGSLDESMAFTCLFYDYPNQKIIIKKDLAGLKLSHSFPVLDVVRITGDTPSVFDQYFALQNIPKRTEPVATGWTSWYNYYNKISESIIEENLNAFAQRDLPIDYFQIDDGWQTRIGDWLSVQPSFPNGMKSVADKIHQKGFKAGLWLSPFVVEPKSRIFQEKKDWLLRGANGKPVAVGYSPYWSGKFYALDFYNREVQDYLTGVFHTVLQTWGFDMVKLDFLYAVAVLPRPNKTRGQVMSDALNFIRRLVGDKMLLACGVPLGSAFGLVDYCRIGADIHLSWEHRLLKFLGNRERVSTIVALRTVFGRWALNKRAFLSDPDVFILRDKKHQLTDIQQDTVFKINSLLGNLLFTSDVVSEYTEGVLEKYKNIFSLKNCHIYGVIEHEIDLFCIKFVHNDHSYIAYCNLTRHIKHINDRLIQPYETVFFDEKRQEQLYPF
jgi:alpha-galactosidase